MTVTQELEKLLHKAKEDITKASTLVVLEDIEVIYLGRKGYINELVKKTAISDLKKIGKEINELKLEIKSLAEERKNVLLDKSVSKVDITLPGARPPEGHLHLITQAIFEIESIFQSLGFVRRRYQEIEYDWYAAEGLNIPRDHPARDDQETFYVNDEIVLTAHTSNSQLREMERVKNPPIKMINIGKTYRRQTDASHSPVFHQFEGLVIDKGINLTNLVGVCSYFAKNYFGPSRRIRLRPHHFQFTEPSFEVDITCDVCDGRGVTSSNSKCRICKSGWLELGGAGMVHPVVLKNGGLNPTIYSGFAFGWGIERVLMMKSGLKIPDLRELYSIDYRFLSQF